MPSRSSKRSACSTAAQCGRGRWQGPITGGVPGELLHSGLDRLSVPVQHHVSGHLHRADRGIQTRLPPKARRERVGAEPEQRGVAAARADRGLDGVATTPQPGLRCDLAARGEPLQRRRKKELRGGGPHELRRHHPDRAGLPHGHQIEGHRLADLPWEGLQEALHVAVERSGIDADHHHSQVQVDRLPIATEATQALARPARTAGAFELHHPTLAGTRRVDLDLQLADGDVVHAAVGYVEHGLERLARGLDGHTAVGVRAARDGRGVLLEEVGEVHLDAGSLSDRLPHARRCLKQAGGGRRGSVDLQAHPAALARGTGALVPLCAQFLVRCGRNHVGPALAVRIDLLSFVPLDLDLEEVLGEQKAAEKGAQGQPQDDKSAIRGRH